MCAAAGFLLHVAGIDCAVEIGHGLENRTRGAVRRHAHLGESRVEFVRLPAVRRDFLRSKRQIAAMQGDVHIARPTGDRAGRNRDFLVGRITHVGITIEEFRKRILVKGRNAGRMFGDESGERNAPLPSIGPANAASLASNNGIVRKAIGFMCGSSVTIGALAIRVPALCPAFP